MIPADDISYLNRLRRKRTELMGELDRLECERLRLELWSATIDAYLPYLTGNTLAWARADRERMSSRLARIACEVTLVRRELENVRWALGLFPAALTR
jgi:hypothetical protein